MPAGSSRKLSSSTTSVCPVCNGNKWVTRNVPLGHPDFGKAVACTACADLLSMSGLNKQDRALVWDDLVSMPDDKKGFIRALTFGGQQIVANKFGFGLIYGNNGTGKSQWAKIITAEFCRSGLRSKYVQGLALEKALFANKGEDEYGGLTMQQYASLPVLVLDEMQGINWNNHWIASRMMELLEQRFDLATAPLADRKITVMVAQFHPRAWGPIEHVSFLISRAQDGGHAFPWLPSYGQAPTCLLERPCICGKAQMKRKGKEVVCPACHNSRPVEMYWPFAVDLNDVRAIKPPIVDVPDYEGELEAV